jgi:hypothetical protein
LLHVILRSTAKANRKARPAYFSKAICLVSLLWACAMVPAPEIELTFVNDGEMEDPRRRIMRAKGEVITGTFDLRHSYGTAIDLVRKRPWPDADLVYFCEDDHLHRPEAMRALVAAAAASPETDYFALYGSVDALLPTGEPLPPTIPVPRRWHSSTDDLVADDDVHWRRALSATSSFAVRAGVMRADAAIHTIGHRTRGNAGAHDHAICLAFQGYAPFPWFEPIRKLVTARDERLDRRLKHAVWETSLNALSLRARAHPHVMLGATPSLACHLEDGVIAAGIDWAAVATNAEQWGQSQSLLL